MKLKFSLQPAVYRRKVSLILVTFTSRSDSDFEPSNFSFKDNKPDRVFHRRLTSGGFLTIGYCFLYCFLENFVRGQSFDGGGTRS